MESDGLEWLSDYLVSALKSPTWVVPIAEFVDNRCQIFDDAEENKLEYTISHNDFKRLVDDLFTAHLLEVSVTPEQFSSFCQRGLSTKEALHHILIEQLLSVEDFFTFKAMMVKRNADLDRRAALEELNRQDNGMLAPAMACAAGALSLSHSSGLVSFANWPMNDGVLAWHDRDFVYFGIPEELNGALLFAGPHKSMPTGTLTFQSSQAATLYLFYENSGGSRDGGFAGRLKFFPEWVKVGGTHMKWGTVKGKDMWMAVWSRKVPAGATINMNMQEPFVGGFAVMADTGEWRLYEEQEQLMKALTASGMEDVSRDEELAQAASMAEDAGARLEQAQLEQAIALSLQAEEERLRQIETLGAEVSPAAPEMQPLPVAAAAPYVAEPLAPLMAPLTAEPAPLMAPMVFDVYAKPEPAPLMAPLAAPLAATYAAPAPISAAPAPTMMASPEAVEASKFEEPIPDLPPLLHAPKEINAVMPHMMRLQPLVAAPSNDIFSRPALPNNPMTDQLRADAILRRERAENAISSSSQSVAAPAPPAYSPPAAASQQGPTEEERRARSEHLKRQRAALMEKRKGEREQQLQAYHLAKGSNQSSVDRMASAAAGAGLQCSLSGGEPAPPVQPDQAEAAQRMRQALTLQLRQSLTSTVASDTLGQSVNQLEGMNRR